MDKQKKAKFAMLIVGLILLVSMFAIQTLSLPVGPRIEYVSNETSNSTGIGTARSGDKGGYITTIRLNASQQNFAWKAYVGNVTGNLVLENRNNYSIYEWAAPTGNQEVYISRNGSVDWNSVNCSNRTIIEAEDTLLKLNSSNTNSINKTFASSVHKSFVVAGRTIQNSTCPAIATYVNDAAQGSSETAKFQEVLLKDTASNLIYAAMVDKATQGYDTSNYDFQAIVAEDETLITPTTYYFYVELA